MSEADPFWRPGGPLANAPIRARQVLDQFPVPAIALADDGAVVFANKAFANALGCSCDAVTSMSYAAICSALPTDETLIAVTQLGPDTPFRSLLQLDRATFLVKMCKSALVDGAYSVATTMFAGLMERLSDEIDSLAAQ